MSPASGSCDAGTSVTLTAEAAPGWELTGWSRDGQTLGSSASLSVIPAAGDLFTATFSLRSYEVNVICDPTKGTVSGVSTGIYPYGTGLVLRATPASGYAFSHWIVNGETASDNPVLAHTVAGHTAIEAVFMLDDPGAVARVEVDRSLVITPQPMYDWVSVDGSMERIDRLEIFDVGGRLVLLAEDLRPRRSVAVGHLSTGLHIIRVHTPQGVFSRKVLKK